MTEGKKWSARIAEKMRHAAIINGDGYVLVGSKMRPNAFISSERVARYMMGDGVYITMIDAIEAARRGELMNDGLVTEMMCSIHDDIWANVGGDDCPKLAAIIVDETDIYISDIEYPAPHHISPSSTIVFTNDVYADVKNMMRLDDVHLDTLDSFLQHGNIHSGNH